MKKVVCLTVILLLTNAVYADKALVMTESTLSVTGLKDAYKNKDSIDFEVRVPRSNVIRARLEVIVFRGDLNGRALYQKLRDYDRYTSVGSLSYKIVLPSADRAGALSLFLRVRGVRTGRKGADVEPFEESLIWPLSYVDRSLATTESTSGTCLLYTSDAADE